MTWPRNSRRPNCRRPSIRRKAGRTPSGRRRQVPSRSRGGPPTGVRAGSTSGASAGGSAVGLAPAGRISTALSTCQRPELRTQAQGSRGAADRSGRKPPKSGLTPGIAGAGVVLLGVGEAELDLAGLAAAGTPDARHLEVDGDGLGADGHGAEGALDAPLGPDVLGAAGRAAEPLAGLFDAEAHAASYEVLADVAVASQTEAVVE